jgi:hypothetical protein
MVKNPIIQLLIIILFNIIFTSNTSALNINTVSDRNFGVACEIYLVDGTDKYSRIGHTDQEGHASIECNCTSGQKLVADPYSYQYDKSFRTCPIQDNSIKMIVPSKRITAVILNHGDKAYAIKDFKKAAFIYNEALQRIMLNDRRKSNEIRMKIYISAGHIFSIADPIVIQSPHYKPVMSPQLKEAIQRYQRVNLLAPNGYLDYPTLSSIANMDTSDIIFQPR